MVCLVLGKTLDGVRIWKDGKCLAGGIEGWQRAWGNHWGHGGVEECRERGWLGEMGNRGLVGWMGKGQVEEQREVKLDSWSKDEVGRGWDNHFNWELLIHPDSKSVLWLGQTLRASQGEQHLQQHNQVMADLSPAVLVVFSWLFLRRGSPEGENFPTSCMFIPVGWLWPC